MINQYNSLRRALRFLALDQSPCAGLELDAIVDAEQEQACRAVFCLRGRVKQQRNRYPEAIADYMKALSLETPGTLNQRNTLRILQNIVECGMRVKDIQRGPLQAILRREFGLSTNVWFPSEIQLAQPPRCSSPRRPPITPISRGRIANIGKFLLDERDLQKLASLVSDPHASGVRRLTTYCYTDVHKTISHELKLSPEAQQIKHALMRALERIDKHPGVIGSCIVGCNGVPIVSNLPAGHDAELVGMYSLGLYTQTMKISEQLGNAALPAIILRAEKGYSVVANCGFAFIVCLTKEQDATKLAEILKELWNVMRDG